MTRVPVSEIDTVGVVYDQSPHMLVPEAWTDARNMRFKNRKASRILGHKEALGTPVVEPGFLLNVPGLEEASFWLYGNLSKIYVNDNGVHTDVTRGSGDYNASNYWDWGSCLIGGVPIVNNFADVPQYWSALDTGTKLADLSNWNTYPDANLRAKIVRAYGQFLIALNVKTDAGTFPHRIIWSHQAEPGAVPSSWDVSSALVDAGQRDLTDVHTGQILDGLMLGNQFYIYKEAATHVMRFIGGTEVMALDYLFDSGILATRCVCLIDRGRKHFVVTEKDIIVHSGTKESKSVVDEKVRESLFSSIDENRKVQSFCFDNRSKNEAWFVYPTSGAMRPDRALVYNYANETITFRDWNGLAVAYGTVTDADIGIWGENANVLLHFNGTDASTTITDEVAGHTWTVAGNAQLDTADKALGSASLLLDGTGDWVTTSDHADFTIGSEWTWDFRFKSSVAGGTTESLAGQADSSLTAAASAWYAERHTDNTIRFHLSDGTNFTTLASTTTFVSGHDWAHVRVTLYSGVLRMWINGTLEDSEDFTGSVNDSSNDLRVGTAGENTTNPWTGWIDEFSMWPVAMASTETEFVIPTEEYSASVESPDVLWSEDTEVWDPLIGKAVVIADPEEQKFYTLEEGNAYGANTVTTFLERTGLALIGRDRSGRPMVDYSVRKQISRIWPKLTGVGASTVKVSVGTQEEIDGMVTWSTPKFFIPTQRFLDFDNEPGVSGRLMAVRFESTEDKDWTLSGYDLEINVLGEN